MRRRKADSDRWVEAVLQGDRLPEGRLDDPAAIAALRAAIELRSARPGADQPGEQFVTALRQQLAGEQALDHPPTPATAGQARSRRAVLAGAGTVAAGLVGALADRTLLKGPGQPPDDEASEVAPNDGQWVAVAADTELSVGGVQRFATPGLVGFVSDHQGAVSAVSGACTHRGCLLALDPTNTRLDCPCHRSSFALDGNVIFHQLDRAPRPLPSIQARRHDGHVEVFVPKV